MLRLPTGPSAAYGPRHVESVQIDVPETLGVATGPQFYDATGAVLDMLVTHLFQVAAEVAMEPPASLGAPTCRPPGRRSSAVSGRWTLARWCWASSTGTGTCQGSIPGSSRDTFVAARLWIDNDRWRGVPFTCVPKRWPPRNSGSA